jgi:hypothetical protein
MSTVPRLPGSVPDQPVVFGSILGHQPALARGFSQLYAQFWSHGVLDHVVKETARLRNARITDCGY